MVRMSEEKIKFTNEGMGFFAHLSIGEGAPNKTALRVIVAQAICRTETRLEFLKDEIINLNLTSNETVQSAIRNALPSRVKACVFVSEGVIDGLVGDMVIKALEDIFEGTDTVCSRVLYTHWGLKTLADIAADCQDLRITPESFEVRPKLISINKAVQKIKGDEELQIEDLADVRSILALFRKAKEKDPHK